MEHSMTTAWEAIAAAPGDRNHNYGRRDTRNLA